MSALKGSAPMSTNQPQLEAKPGRTLLVLMWQHYLVRKRRFCIAFLEFSVPVLFFVTLAIFHILLLAIFAKSRGNDSQSITLPKPDLITEFPKPSVILYLPKNNLTDSLMKKVGDSLGLKLMEKISYTTPGYFGSNDNSFINQQFKLFEENKHAFVLFKNVAGEQLPDHIYYTIRMNENFKTKYRGNIFDELSRDPSNAVIYLAFVRLQWAIDSSFLELRSGQKIKQALSLQEFPYKLSSNFAKILSLILFHFALMISLLLPFEFIMARLMEERASGVQELLLMVGVTAKTLGLGHFLNILPGGVLYSVLGAYMLTGDKAIMEHSNIFLIALFLFLHFTAVVAMAFACSFITNNTEHTNSISTFLYCFLTIPSFIIQLRGYPSKLLVPFTGLTPFIPSIWFYYEANSLEITRGGITWKTMMSSHTGNSLSMFWVYVFLLLHTVIFLALAWYLSLVRPTKRGAALPWDFIFKKYYWSKTKVHPNVEIGRRELQQKEAKYFEPHPPYSEVGIYIQNVTKKFHGFVALNNVTLPVLKEEITVLLGHNGAGKTTLMSIITGTVLATSGKVYVNGLDTVTQKESVRTQLGFCPQHHLFFSELTVFQHARLFCLIKGNMSWKQSQQSARDLLKQLGLDEKANSLSKELSGGMKRRLQLACALAGNANVLVLDEPTAGLDVETRRGLWDLLLSLRAGRTVLLSTHFMEEADALGNRIAALHNGTVRCDASPMHLKKEIDTGYYLAITLKPGATQSSVDEISDIITSVMPQAREQSVAGIRTLSFKLPSRESDKFPQLFKKLEDKRDKVGIDSMTVGISTIEEVFLKLCSDTIVVEDDVVATLQDDRSAPKIVGKELLKQQFVALFIRQFRFIRSSWKMFGFLQIVMPLLILMALTWYANDPDKGTNEPVEMNLDLYKQKSNRFALSNFEIPVNHEPCCGLKYTPSDNIPQTLAEKLKNDEHEYHMYIIGITLNNSTAMAHYTTYSRHALPVSVNTMSNAIGSFLTNQAVLRITTINHPIQEGLNKKVLHPKSDGKTMLWAKVTTFVIQSCLLSALVLPGTERVSSSRHTHLMTGCPPELYWLTTLLYHSIYSIVILVIPTLIFVATLDFEHTFSQASFMFPLALLLVGGCLSSIALAFLFSFMMPHKRAATTLSACYFVFIFLIPTAALACEFEVEKDWECKMLVGLTMAATYTVTPITFLEAMKKMGTVARMNAYCKLNKRLCPNLEVLETGFDNVKCCQLNQPPRCYFCFDEFSPFIYIIALYIQFLVLMVSVVLTERGIFKRLQDLLMKRKLEAEEAQREEVLESERQYVEQSLKTPRGDAMLVSEVHKLYRTGMSCTPIKAVRGISFAVREGECFGLVGVNGAGKSTTFKMMTCDTCPTRGIFVANGQHQKMFDNSKYLHELGYCPQFLGVDEFLTGRQNLELILILDGLDKKDAKVEAVKWLELIDLMKYADRKVSAYSGGCSRRLSSVAALARRAAMSLLDEPTAGVDVAARRQLWRAVKAAQAQTTLAGSKRAVLITSHSMDEMEALCSRVTIMSAGRLVALGSPAELRAAHNAGHSIFIKIRDVSVSERGTEDELQELKTACEDNGWELKDEHKVILNYQVDKDLDMEYSDLFTELENLRRTFPDLIEDYAVTATTLEEVFLSYADEAKNVNV